MRPCVCVCASRVKLDQAIFLFFFGRPVCPVGPAWREHTSPSTHTTHALLSFFSVTYGRSHEWKWSGVACWRVPGESRICVSKVCARAAHHMFCQTPWSLIPLFCQYFHSIWFHQAEDYTGLDNLPEADMHSFIKKKKRMQMLTRLQISRDAAIRLQSENKHDQHTKMLLMHLF